MAVESHTKALKAAEFLKKEITPYKTTIKDKDGNEKEVLVDRDDGPRETTFEGASKLKPAFKKDGTTTAGNSS